MKYKNYIGSLNFSENGGLFFGKVQEIKPLISYEHLKSATEIALLILIRVFFKNSRFTARSRGLIKRPRKLKFPAVLNFKERLKSALKWHADFNLEVCSKTRHLLRFLTSLQNRVFSNSRI